MGLSQWSSRESHQIVCRPSSLDVQFVDFDGVRFHLSTPERKTSLLLSMHIRCWEELVRYGALDILKREYGALLLEQAEQEYNVSLEIDLEQIPSDSGTFTWCFPTDVYYNAVNIRGSRGFHSICCFVQTECTGGSFRTGLQDTEGAGSFRQRTRRAHGDSLS